MDRETNRKRRETVKDQSTVTLESVLLLIDEGHKEASAAIDKTIKTRAFGKTNAALKMIQGLLDMDTANTRITVLLSFQLEELQKRLDNLETIVQNIAENMNDLPDIKSQLAILKKQSIPKPALKYINEFQEQWEEWKKQQNKYFGKGVHH